METTSTMDLIGAIGPDELATFLTADPCDWFGLYPDGSVAVGDSVGQERDPEERPVVAIRCPGLGNADMTYWRADGAGEGMDDADVIRWSCEEGDVTGEVEDLRRRLIEALDD